MKKLFALGTVAVSLALACAAYAYPTLNGGTGLIVQPNAKVVCPGTLDVAVDYYNTNNDVLGINDTYPIRATYGISNKFEVGAAYLAQSSNNGWGINAKYTDIVRFWGFNWGAGANYIATNGDITDTNFFSIYWVGDYTFCTTDGPAADISLGLNWTNIDNDFISGSGIRGFLGVDVAIAKGLSFVGDIQTENDDLDLNPEYSVGLRYLIIPSLTVQAGYTNAAVFSGADDSNFFVGVNYNFGLAVPTEE